uniref:(northern house mosquito) hypothetical protein n=1 Tax=Culex pipiens TaxID=7175 RepID=A0A8D8N559_CULPI
MRKSRTPSRTRRSFHRRVPPWKRPRPVPARRKSPRGGRNSSSSCAPSRRRSRGSEPKSLKRRQLHGVTGHGFVFNFSFRLNLIHSKAYGVSTAVLQGVTLTAWSFFVCPPGLKFLTEQIGVGLTPGRAG